MAIREGGVGVITRPHVEQAQNIGLDELARVKRDVWGACGQGHWKEASEHASRRTQLDGTGWLQQLQEFLDSLPVEPVCVSASAEAWQPIVAELREKVQRAGNGQDADEAGRMLLACLSDAFSKTGDGQFDPRRAPQPARRTIRNPNEARDPVDRSKWKHLLS